MNTEFIVEGTRGSPRGQFFEFSRRSSQVSSKVVYSLNPSRKISAEKQIESYVNTRPMTS